MREVIVFKDDKLELKVGFEEETVWLNQSEIAQLFEKDRTVITRHINNILKDKEVDEKSNVQKMHIANSDKPVKFYSLDIVLAVGYRTNSARAIKFRQWATNVLKQYLIKGYTLNKERLQEQKIKELDKTIQLIKQGLDAQALSTTEAKGFVEIISNYAKSWALLQGYDEQSLEEIVAHKEQRFILDYDEAKEAIAQLKQTLIAKGEATKLFGSEKAGEFKGNLLNIYQSFGGVELLPSIEQKASNLLYYVIKGHPFIDGNKRIGAYLFVLFLHKNGVLHKPNGEPKINDNALASLALLVATSAPEQKDIIIKLIMNMLYEGDI
ncbi:Putative DNA-binding protein in cluster with Type I restriction-modification system [hydrothermal vent metagenome]|uniref:Putative DNA-binding protein in cluster with Type I restriction-modification system n=1 Tax=hydrothermal vent metagenome TaxID=652676 RepID=A0A1W1BRR5_9ZZZZ